MHRQSFVVSVALVGAFALSGCGGNSDDAKTNTSTTTTTTTTTSSDTATSSDTSTSSTSSGTAAGGGSAMDCLEAASAGVGMAAVGLSAMTGTFDQAAYDKAFPAGEVDKLPEDLRDEYTAAADAAKALIGTKGEDAIKASDSYNPVLTKYSDALSAHCAG